MRTSRTHTPLFFPAGLISLVCLLLMTAQFITGQARSIRASYLEFHLASDEAQLPDDMRLPYGGGLIKKFVLTHQDFEQSHNLDALSDACSLIQTSKSPDQVMVILGGDCTVADFVRASQLIRHSGLHGSYLHRYRGSRYNLRAWWENTTTVSWPEVKPQWQGHFLMARWARMLSAIQRCASIVWSDMTEQPVTYLLILVWLVLASANLRQFLELARQRRRLTLASRRSHIW